MLSGTAGEQIPVVAHRPKHRKPDDVAILPVGDAGGRTYEELYVEHAPVARRVALSMVPRDVADDIVAEAFTRVLGAIRAGGGPGLAFRAYLLAAVRNTANDWLRASRRTTVIGDVEQDLDHRVPDENMSVARLSRGPEAEAEAHVEARLVARAFAHLPTRWRAVLWQLEVEGHAPAAIAPVFGLSANGVSALAVRAREGLRQAYLQEHIGSNIPASCRSYADALGADARGRLSGRRHSAVHEHLEQCTGCHALASELTELNSRLGSILTPAALAAALGGGGAALSTGAGPAGAGAAKAAASAKTGAGIKAGAGLKTSLAAEGGRAWAGGHWRLLRLHPLTAAAGAAAGLAAAGGMVFAVSVTPAGPSPVSVGTARTALPVGALSSAGPLAHPGVPGTAGALGAGAAIAPVSGVTGSACPGGTGGSTVPDGTTPGCAAAAGAGSTGAATGAPAGSTSAGTGTVTPPARHTTASGTPAVAPSPATGPVGTITQGVRSDLGTSVGNLGQVVAGATQAAGTVLGPTVSGLGTVIGATTQNVGAGLSNAGLGAAGSTVTNVGASAAATVQGLGGTVSSTTGQVGNVVGNLSQGIGAVVGGNP